MHIQVKNLVKTFKHRNVVDGVSLRVDKGEIVGGKTGYTDEAGLCLASEAIVNDRKYIAITVNAEGNHNTEPFHVEDAF